MKPIIEVTGLSKSYKISHQAEMQADYSTLKDDFANLIKKPFGGGLEDEKETFWALKDVSFEIKQGEAFGIIGKNGSGKSTLLKILSRIVEPTAGKVKLEGRVASLLEVGTGFHPELTGRENVFFNGSMLGMSRHEIRKKFNEIVDFSGVEKFLDTPVKFYSSGMYVRLAFAVAAHLDPEILILDEVLAVGDAQFQKKSLNKMMSIAKGGRTIIFVSHGLDAVEELCDRAMLLQKGKVKLIGESEGVIDQYLGESGAPRLGVAETANKSSRVDESYGQLVAIEKIAVSHDKTKFYYAEDLSFDALVVSKELVKEPVFLGIGVTDPTGRRIFTYESPKALNLKRGEVNVTCNITSPRLMPGLYNIDVGIRTSNKTLDYISQALSFKVKNHDRKGRPYSAIYNSESFGFVVPEAQLRMTNDH
jgi:lipopolysaccharide transport system ATP-binding protein